MLMKRRNLTLAIAVSLGSALVAGAPAQASTDAVEFDLNQLQKNGFGADMARFFAHQARFLPGLHTVGVSVNAGRRKELQVRFGSEGEACIDSVLMGQLGLRVPAGHEQADCIDLGQAIAGAKIVTRPGTAQIDLTVPQDAFIKGIGDDLQRGGKAVLLNYDLFSQRYESRNGSRGYVSGRFEAGVNAANWALRSRASYSSSPEATRFIRQETFAQRPLEQFDALLQVGQLSSLSDSFGGMPIEGVQLFSDVAQHQAQTLAVPITGFAEGNAVVEIRQRNQLVYRTVVAPGAFSISDVGSVASGTDIDVVVIEEDGREQHFTVPAPMKSADLPQRATFHLGAGRYRELAGQDITSPRPWLLFADYSFNPIRQVRVTTSGLLSADYLGAAAQGTWSPAGRVWMGGGLRVSNSSKLGVGAEWQLQGNARLPAGFSAGLSWQTRSRGFTLLDDTLYYRADAERPQPFEQSTSASLGWSHARWGSLSYAVAHSRFDGETRLSHSLSASRRFGRVSTSLSLQHSQQRGTAAFLNVQVPLGRSSLSARAYQYESGAQVVGASYSGRFGSDKSYQLDASRSDESQRLGGSVRAQTAYGSLAAGVSQVTGGTRAWYGSVSGGIALTDDGSFAMSASRIGDTFAIVKVPDVSGIRMSGASSARTSWLGTALLPSVSPYRLNRIQLDGKTLPLNYRFDTTAVDLKLARGTVATHTINATEIRQLMLSVTTASGSARVGSAVYDAAGDFISTVVGDGNVVLVNEQIGQPIFIEQGGQRCEVQYQAPSRFNPDVPYEEVPARCG